MNNSYNYTVGGNGSMQQQTWFGKTDFLVDNTICTVSTTYRIAYYVTIWSQNFNGNTWSSSAGIPAHFTLIANTASSYNNYFTNYQAVPSSITGITTTDLLCTNFLLAKAGIASVQGFVDKQSTPTNFLNFYYDSVNSKIELWLDNGNGNDIGASNSNTYYTQRLGYLTQSVSKSTGTRIVIYNRIPDNLTIQI